MKRFASVVLTVLLTCGLGLASPTVAAEPRLPTSGAAAPLSLSSRIVITYAASGGAEALRSGSPTRPRRAVVDLGRPVTDEDLAAYQGPGVVAVERDSLLKPLVVPNDPSFSAQWDMSDAGAGGADYSIKAPGAWAITTGDPDLVVAVLDTGITSHSEFTGRVVPGYDFIDDALTGNDGNGRDSNPADPGDWISKAENRSGYFAGCGVSNSSWHGTHVAGTIAATGNNGSGIAGINWGSKILPVRVLGKCGGYGTDIADAIVWASGGTVDGVSNPNPARIINLSLGGRESCPVYMQSAIDEARANNALVVVAAGNENVDVSSSQPANCSGVIAVAATGRNGKRAFYSNYGAGVTIAAPGGNSYSDSKILSTLNSGTQSPQAETYASYQGTSMATPHVAGVLSLLLSVDPSLTEAEVIDAMQSTATPFPTDLSANSCSVADRCGPGIIDATALVESVLSEERTAQTIEFGALESRYAGSAPFSPGATATSGLSVTYSATPSVVCTSNGVLITPRSAGTCTITASQGGDLEYLPADPVSQGVTIIAATVPAVVSDATFPSNPQIGTSLTLTAGTWGGSPAPDIAYQWYRCSSSGSAVTSTRDPRGCSSITAASGLSYTPLAADAGRYLRVRQIASNIAGTITRFSATSSVVAVAPALVNAPSIQSTPRVGRATKVGLGRFSGTAPLSYVYQWYLCGTPVASSSTKQSGCDAIDGASSTTYSPIVSQRGSYLVLGVTVTNAAGELTFFTASSPAVQ